MGESSRESVMEAGHSASLVLSKAEKEHDDMTHLQDAVPQLESLFVLTKCIGHGTFSSVYLARTKHNTTINGRRHFAIKHIIPTSHPSRVYMELKCLKMIGGMDFVMGVTTCFRQMNHIVLVMPYFPHDSFSDYVGHLSTEELREYLVALLMALRRVHIFNIIHRDVKPANFLYNRKHRRYSLVDFGLAQEVGQTRGYSRSNTGRGAAKDGVSAAKTVGQGQGVASKLPSPPFINTPLTSTTKTVKRKLGVIQFEDDDGERGKHPREVSSPTGPLGGILTSTSSRLNNALRRSPRKQSIPLSPKKENYEALVQQELRHTPQKKHLTNTIPEDSPSKHTRGAEACRKLECLDGGGCGMNATLQIKGELLQTPRRSPRKAVSRSLTSGPREGLLKQLSQVTVMQEGNSHTPVTKENRSKTEASSSCELQTSVQNSSQRQRQGQTGAVASPRVSGLTLTPDLQPLTSRAIKTPRLLQEVKTKSGSMLCPVSCHCYGSAKVCGVCVARGNQVAPRAGTPGFRAPEVLLRHPKQGTGVDMWSVGVILLSLLSGRYPFFRAADDLSTLAEITTLLGTSTVRKAAAKIDKLLTCSEERVPLDLMKVCEILRNNSGNCSNPDGEDTSSGHVCHGCHQRNICVCLIPRMQAPAGHSAHSSKKRTSSHESHKRNPRTVLISPASPTKKRSKNGTGYKIPGTHITQHSLLASIHSNTVAEGCRHSTINKPTLTSQVHLPETPASLEKHLPYKSTLSASTSTPSKDTNGKCAPPAYPSLVYHLLMRLLDPDPETRITAEEALAHPFLAASP